MCIAVAAAALAAAILGALRSDAFIANDAAQYIDSATNILEGKGYSTNLLYYDQHYAVGGLPAKQTVWPPLYPFLIALVGTSGLSADQAAFLVALISYLLIPLLLLATLRRMGHAPGRALGLSSLWYLFAQPWGNVLHRLSDMTFALLTVLSLYCLVASSERSERGRAWLLLAGAVASLAFATRYAGIFFIASVGIFYGLCFVLDRRRFALPDLVALMLAPVSVVAGFFVHNLLLAGTLTGGADPHQGGSVATVFDKHLTLVSKVFGFSDDGFLGARPAEMLFLAFVVLGALLVFFRRRDLGNLWRALALADWHRASQLSLWYIVFTLSALSFLGLTKLTGYLHPRYTISLIPFGIIVLAQFGWPSMRDGGRAGVLARAVALCGLAAFVAGQLNVARAVWARGTGNSLYLALIENLNAPLGSGTARDFLRSNASRQSPVLANESQMLGYILSRPVLGMAPANYSARTWDVDATRSVCATYRVGYVVFFRDHFDQDDPWNANLTFLAALAAGRQPDWLVRILETESLRVYRVDHDLL